MVPKCTQIKALAVFWVSTICLLCPLQPSWAMGWVWWARGGHIAKRSVSKPLSGWSTLNGDISNMIKIHTDTRKYTQIRGLDIRQYADIRGRFAQFTVTYPRMNLVTSAL